jgi:hypothetical protein
VLAERLGPVAVLAPNQELRVLGTVDPLAEHEVEILEAARISNSRAYDRGFQRGLLAAGEPWVALLAALGGGLLGLVVGLHAG